MESSDKVQFKQNDHKVDKDLEDYLRARRVKTQHAWFMKNFVTSEYREQ